MTLTQQLTNLISSASQSDEFEISKTELYSHFGGINDFLHQDGWLIQDYQKRFLCPECGATHEVHFLQNRFFIGCDTDEYAEPLELSKDELIIYSFSFERLAVWINKQLQLAEEVKRIGEGVWYLGILKRDGKNRKIYFTLAQNIASVPHSPDQVVLMLGVNEHQELEAINFLSLLSASEKGFHLDNKKLLSDLSVHIELDGLIVKISDDLLLNEVGERGKKKCWIHFGKQQNGQFEYVIGIKPQSFNIVYHLYKLPANHAKKSSAELWESGGLATRKRTITTRIIELNKILTDKNFPELIVTDSDGRHYINPSLRNGY
ncbi:MAG: hypothetical protein ABI425_04305 [Patescibacteria group bacterium]